MGSPHSFDMEPQSSPAKANGRSFFSQAPSDDEDSRMVGMTPDPAEKSSRSKSKSSQPGRGAQDSQSTFGKIRHLKKEDGDPLWRKDIQYDFLKAIFDDEQKVFTNSYQPDEIGKQCFADLYIDTMARSTKTSKVLRDKLLSDRDAAKGMAMVCLLVNIGRMNTTLNFFPEMRAQLRTYHAIPSLQARQDPHAYKQLQDAPRLKSILKGSSEDRTEPVSLVTIKDSLVPRTNPVNLLFVICASAQKIAELHFPHGQEFHDLVMKTNYTSKSRAMAFLWLMWFYLESDFTEEGCEENPFGAGVDYGLHVANQGVPRLEEMTPEEEELENVDTPDEVEFGEEKQRMRAKILEADLAYHAESQTKRGARNKVFYEDGPAILPRIRPSKHDSDLDSVRSTPPPKAISRPSGIGGSSRRGGAPYKYPMDVSSPAGPSQGDGVVPRKPRPLTAHQLAVERHRKEQVDHILDRGMRKQHGKARRSRRREGALFRAMRRVRAMSDELAFQNSDDEEETRRTGFPERGYESFRSSGPGGLCQLVSEPDDFGEETQAYISAMRRTERRLKRWANVGDAGVVATIKRKRQEQQESPDHHDDDIYDGINGLMEQPSIAINDHPAEEETEAPEPQKKKRKRAPKKSKETIDPDESEVKDPDETAVNDLDETEGKDPVEASERVEDEVAEDASRQPSVAGHGSDGE